LKQEHTQEFRE